MALAVRMRLQGDEEFEAALRRIDIAANPYIFAPVFRRWALTGASIAKEKYLSGPRPQRLGVVTHRLRSSVDASEFAPPGYIEFGTDVIYGPTHEFGAPERGIPARPFIAPSAEEAFEGVPADLVRAWEGQL